MKKLVFLSLVISAVLAGNRKDVLGEQVTLEPTEDSFVGTGGSGFGDPSKNHGTETELSVGYQAGITTRSYLKFDVSTSNIPADSMIHSATFSLFCTRWTSGANVNMSISYSAGPWIEGDITWNNQPGIGSGIGITTASGIGRTTDLNLLSVVNTWRSGTDNDGIVVSHSQQMLWVGSREGPEIWRPWLVVTYTPPFSVSGVHIDIDPEDPETVEQGGTVTGDGTITGTGGGTVKYYWMVRKPTGIFEPASSLLSTTMTGGSATVPSFSDFPTSDLDQHKVWIRIQSPGGPDDSLSNEEFYTVVLPDPSVELTLYRISAPDGAQNTVNPGSPKTIFRPGETLRVTLRADNAGGDADVRTVLNILEPDNSTILYDSHDANTTDSDSIEDNSFDSPLTNSEGYDYYSFDKIIPINANPGQYDIGAAIRNLTLWDEVYDTTAPGRNDEDWINFWLEDEFSVEILTVPVQLEVGSAVFRDGAFFGLDWHTGIFWFYDGYFDEYRVIQANGPGYLLGDVIWSQFLDGNNYRGAREHTDSSPPSALEREEAIYWAKYQFNAEYTAVVGWGPGLYNHPNTSYQSGDGRFRCDQFVEYVYASVFGTDLRPGYLLDTPRTVFNGDNAVSVLVTSPHVVSVQHTNYLDTDIIIEFSELMSAGTLDPNFGNAISVIGDLHGSYKFGVTFESEPLYAREDLFEHSSRRHDCKRVIVETVEDFLPGENITLTVSTTARDLGGNPMDSAYIDSFIVYRRADFDQDADVDRVDLGILVAAWLTEPGNVNWNPDCDISMPVDNLINFQDFAEFGKYWQEGID